MTDAREIIAKAVEEKLKIDGFSSYEEMAEHLTQALTTSGFRILGPDEVDPVTVEKAAEVAANWGSEIPAEIRAIGRKA